MKRRALIPPVVLFLLGISSTIIGALFKIQHWPYGALILSLGSLLEILAIFWMIIVLIKMYRNN
nr:hypothetical protein [uncultured Psychroserpens sp.]